MLTFKYENLDWKFEVGEDNWLRVTPRQGPDYQFGLPPGIAIPLVENLMAVLRINENIELLDR